MFEFIQTYEEASASEAANYLGCSESKKDPAMRACFEEIVTYEGGSVSNEAWCMKFIWMILNKMCLLFGIINPIKKTASTIDFKSQAEKKGIPVDRTPAIGSVFFRYRDGGGHVGLVVELFGDDGFHTIEGNSSDKVKTGEHYLSETTYYFIHVETLFAGKELIAGFGLNWYLIASVLGAGYYLWRKLK